MFSQIVITRMTAAYRFRKPFLVLKSGCKGELVDSSPHVRVVINNIREEEITIIAINYMLFTCHKLYAIHRLLIIYCLV